MQSPDSSPAAEEPVVRLDRVFKTFRDFWHRPKVRAVKGLTLHIRSGEVFGLLGPNGSGKSTTLKMILGLLNPSSGFVSVFGRSPRHVATKARIGYLPEETRLYPYLTSSEVLHFYGRLFDLTPRECRSRVRQLLDMTGLAHVRDRRVGEFSKGMSRRLGLAQALINDPDLLVLDEPTSGLDPIGCRQVKDLIQALGRRGKTVLLSSHLLADVQDVCDRIAILRHGRLAVEGGTRELLEDRRTITLNLGDATEDTARAVAATVQERFQLNPRLEHPARTLEDFFLDIVERAPALDAPDISGATPASGVAPYLSSSPPAAAAEDALARLVSPRPVSPAVPAPAPGQAADASVSGAAADERLRDLLSSSGRRHD